MRMYSLLKTLLSRLASSVAGRSNKSGGSARAARRNGTIQLPFLFSVVQPERYATPDGTIVMFLGVMSGSTSEVFRMSTASSGSMESRTTSCITIQTDVL